MLWSPFLERNSRSRAEPGSMECARRGAVLVGTIGQTRCGPFSNDKVRAETTSPQLLSIIRELFWEHHLAQAVLEIKG